MMKPLAIILILISNSAWSSSLVLSITDILGKEHQISEYSEFKSIDCDFRKHSIIIDIGEKKEVVRFDNIKYIYFLDRQERDDAYIINLKIENNDHSTIEGTIRDCKIQWRIGAALARINMGSIEEIAVSWNRSHRK